MANLTPTGAQALGVAADATEFAISGILLGLSDVLPGDELCTSGASAPIATVDDGAGHALAIPWPGTTITSSTVWWIRRVSDLRYRGVHTAEQASRVATHFAQALALGLPYKVLAETNTPPASPEEEDRYLIGTAPTGAWAANAKCIATWANGAWVFAAPTIGATAVNVTSSVMKVFNGTGWNAATSSDGVPGVDGTDGWSPILTVQNDGARKVLQVFWTGGEGPAPSPDGYYLGPSGFVADIEDAVSIGSAARELLTADRTYYVRPDGSDGNTGLADTSGGAFLTIQKAIDVIWHTLDLAGHIVTVQLGDGTYTGRVAMSGPCVGAVTGASNVAVAGSGRAPVVIKGNATTPANVLINTTGDAFYAGARAFIEVRDLKIQSSAVGLHAIMGGQINFANLDFGACSTAHVQAQFGGYVCALTNYSITASAPRHVRVFNAYFSSNGPTVTLTGTPAFSAAFMEVSRMGYMTAQSVTYAGAATGVRHKIDDTSVIFTNGANPASYFPGDTAGVINDYGLFK